MCIGSCGLRLGAAIAITLSIKFLARLVTLASLARLAGLGICCAGDGIWFASGGGLCCARSALETNPGRDLFIESINNRRSADCSAVADSKSGIEVRCELSEFVCTNCGGLRLSLSGPEGVHGRGRQLNS